MKFNLNNRFFNNCFEITVFLILKPLLQNNATTIQTTLWYLLMFTIITPNPAFSAVRTRRKYSYFAQIDFNCQKVKRDTIFDKYSMR